MIEQKKNDWLATMFLSPDKSAQDLATLGITPDNSVIYEEDYYKKVPQIQERFSTKEGTFDDAAFDKYYGEILSLYNKAEEENLQANIADYYDYDPLDYLAPKDGKVRDVAPSIVEFANPDRRSKGLTNLKEISAPTMSMREVAQTNQVFNYETQKFEDWTPNEWGGIKAVARPSLVLAQWDEDGVHEVNGRQVSHKAGELKFNDSGDPYYETLSGRSLAGKELLHVTDTLTVDGSNWNKYDFFDSDGLDKSVAGTVAKTVLKLAPMFIPVIGKVYGGVTAALEVGKLLPVLYKSIEGIATGDLTDSKSAKAANQMQAWFSKFDSSMSDAGKQGFFNVENLGQIIGDSSKQLFQQRMIGKIPLMFSKGSVPSESAIKWGRGLSMAYMAGTSTTEAYDAFKAAGASDRAAGLGMLATACAMHTMMNNDYFKDFWFKDSPLDNSKVRKAIQSVAEKSRKEFEKGAAAETAQGSAKWVMNMSKKIADAFSKLNPESLLYGAIDEGIEETVEEMTMDSVKGMFSALNAVGLIDKEQEYNFGFSVEDMISRYAMSAAGGAIGGAVFNLQGKVEKKLFNNGSRIDEINADSDGFKQLIYLHRQGKGDAIRKELTRLHDKGKLASTNLSAEGAKIVTEGGKTKLVYQSAEKGKSQNDAVYNQISSYMDWIDDTMKEEGLKISDEELEKIILKWKEEDSTLNVSKEQARDIISMNAFENKMKMLVDKGIANRIYEDWNTLTEDILKLKAEMEKLVAPTEGEATDKASVDAKLEAVKNSSEYKDLKQKLEDKRKLRDDIISGNKNDFYFGQWRFALSPELASNFVKTFGIHNYVKKKYGVNWEDLTDEAVKSKYETEYAEYSKLKEKHEIFTAYDMFSEIQNKVNKTLETVGGQVKNTNDLFEAGSTLYEASMIANQMKLAELSKKREEIVANLPAGTTTSPELQQIDSDIKNLENQRTAIESNPLLRVSPALTKKGHDLLKAPQSTADDSQVATYMDSYIKFLEYMDSNGLYMDPDDVHLLNVAGMWHSKNFGSHNLTQLAANSVQMTLEGMASEEMDLSDWTDSFTESILPYITDIVSNFVHGNTTEALRRLSELKNNTEIIESLEGLSDFGINATDALNGIINNILGNVGSHSFEEYVTKVSDLKSKIKRSPVIELLKAIDAEFGRSGDELFNLLDSEIQSFLQSGSIDQYVVENPKALDKLRGISSLIDIAGAIISAASADGYNGDLNKYRIPLGKEALTILGENEMDNLFKDLNILKAKVESLIAVAEANGAKNMIREQAIEKNMRRKFLDLWRGENALVKTFAQIFDVDIEKFINESGLNDVDGDDFATLHAKGTDFETRIFQAIKDKGYSDADIVSNLLRVFDGSIEDIMTGAPTKFTDDPKLMLSKYDQLIYMLSVIATPSQNFEKKIKDVCANPNLKIAPIYSQTYAAKIAYARVTNPSLYNTLLKEMKKIASKSDDLYIKSKDTLDNYIGIYGGAGTGKTRGVARLVAMLLDDNYEIIGCGPSDAQTDNLKASFGEGFKTFDKDALLSNILGGSPNIKNFTEYVLDDNKFAVTCRFKGTLKGKFNPFGSKKRILIIDEVRQFNGVELGCIKRWAVENNVTIIGLGDYIQDSAQVFINHSPNVSNGGQYLESSTDDFFEIKAPELTAPLRPANIAQHDNEVALSSALHVIFDKYWKDNSTTEEQLNTAMSDLLAAGKIKLKYFNQNGKYAGGTKLIDPKSISETVAHLKTLIPADASKQIAIITDNVKKYEQLEDSQVTVVHSSKVQGREFDYVIIDRDEAHKKMGNFRRLKNVYTLSQRARKGTLIATELNDIMESLEDPHSNGDIAVTESQINAFISWKRDAMSKIPDTMIEERKSEHPEQSTTTTDPGDDSGDGGSPSPAPTPTPGPTPTPSGGDAAISTDDEELHPFPEDGDIQGEDNTTPVVETTTPQTTVDLPHDPQAPKTVLAPQFTNRAQTYYNDGDYAFALQLIHAAEKMGDKSMSAEKADIEGQGFSIDESTCIGDDLNTDTMRVWHRTLDTSLQPGETKVSNVIYQAVVKDGQVVEKAVVDVAYNPANITPDSSEVLPTSNVESSMARTFAVINSEEFISSIKEDDNYFVKNLFPGLIGDPMAKKVLHCLRSYYLFDHYKNDDGINRLKNALVRAIPGSSLIRLNNYINMDSISRDPKFISKKIGDNVWICADLGKDSPILVPLFISHNKISENMIFTGIKHHAGDNMWVNTDTFVRETVPAQGTAELKGYRVLKDAVVIINPLAAPHPIDWVNKHNGKTYQVVCMDMLVSDDEMIDYLSITREGGEDLAHKSDSRFMLFGCKLTAPIREFVGKDNRKRPKMFAEQVFRFVGTTFSIAQSGNPDVMSTLSAWINAQVENGFRSSGKYSFNAFDMEFVRRDDHMNSLRAGAPAIASISARKGDGGIVYTYESGDYKFTGSLEECLAKVPALNSPYSWAIRMYSGNVDQSGMDTAPFTRYTNNLLGINGYSLVEHLERAGQLDFICDEIDNNVRYHQQWYLYNSASVDYYPNSVFKKNTSPGQMVWDVASISGTEFTATGTLIDGTSDKTSKYNEQLHEMGIDSHRVASEEHLPEVLDSLNEERRSESTSWKTEQIVLDEEGNLAIEEVDMPEVGFKNRLINLDPKFEEATVKIPISSRNMYGFLVSLHEEQHFFIVNKASADVGREVSPEYFAAWSGLILDMNQVWKYIASADAKAYISALIEGNNNVSSRGFLEYCKSEMAINMGIADKINRFLLEKLSNDEC